MTSTPAETREAVDDAEVMRIWRECGLPEYLLGNGGTNRRLVAFAQAVARALLASHGERDAVLEEALAIAEQEADRWRVRTNGGAYSTAQKIAHAIRSLKTGEG